MGNKLYGNSKWIYYHGFQNGNSVQNIRELKIGKILWNNWILLAFAMLIQRILPPKYVPQIKTKTNWYGIGNTSCTQIYFFSVSLSSFVRLRRLSPSAKDSLVEGNGAKAIFKFKKRFYTPNLNYSRGAQLQNLNYSRGFHLMVSTFQGCYSSIFIW